MGYCCRIFTPVQPVYPAASRGIFSLVLSLCKFGIDLAGSQIYEKSGFSAQICHEISQGRIARMILGF